MDALAFVPQALALSRAVGRFAATRPTALSSQSRALNVISARFSFSPLAHGYRARSSRSLIGQDAFLGTRVAFVHQTGRNVLRMQSVSVPAKPTTKEVGEPETLEYRVFFYVDGEKSLSPWHDIPLYVSEADGVVNTIVEIPKGTRAKMEIATTEKGTPIKQDTKKGKLRYYTYGDMLFNYGAIPQTWEDPSVEQEETEAKGDNDPVDVVEIGSAAAPIGSLIQVKVLGCLGLIDEGECDWKIIGLNTSDPLASKVNDLKDVETYFPGVVDTIRTWFRDYKIPDGKEANSYAFGGEARDKEYALKVIAHTHDSWKKLMSGATPADDLSLE